MLAWAEHEFRLGQPLDDGASQREHLESAARQLKALGKPMKEELVPEGPPFPDLLDYLWSWFAEISLGLAVSGMAPPVVTWADVAAWRAQTGEVVEPWEARAIVSLGSLRAGIAAEAAREKSKQAKPSRTRRR